MIQAPILAQAVKKTPTLLLTFVPLKHLSIKQGKSNCEGASEGNQCPLASPFGNVSCEVNGGKPCPLASGLIHSFAPSATRQQVLWFLSAFGFTAREPESPEVLYCTVNSHHAAICKGDHRNVLSIFIC